MTKRVSITAEAEEILNKIRAEHGPLIFHQSGGCCDGSSPMCLEDGDLMIDENDVFLGIVADCPFYMSKGQFEYWKHTQLTIDITKGRGSSFSLEIPLGLRFVIKSRLYSEQEQERLTPVSFGPN